MGLFFGCPVREHGNRSIDGSLLITEVGEGVLVEARAGSKRWPRPISTVTARLSPPA
jgi:hypothetical protein